MLKLSKIKIANKFAGGAVTGITVLLFLLFLFLRPPVYQLNDDVELEAILSGAYCGTPDYHTVYMRAPLAFLLALLYRIVPVFPWMGILGAACSLFCILCFLLPHALRKESTLTQFLTGMIPAAGFVLLYFSGQLFLPHYTILAAMCGAAGLYLLLTTGVGSEHAKNRESAEDGNVRDKQEFDGEKWWDVIAAVCIILCAQIRFQVFLMLVPFLGLSLFYRLLRDREEKKEKEKRVRWQMIVPILVFAVLELLHFLAYSSPEWKEYQALNDARTLLYDYVGVWENEEARSYYREIGVEDEAYPLYRYYDILPEQADAERLKEMAAYGGAAAQISTGQHIRNVLYELRMRMQGKEDMPYNMVLLAGAVFTMLLLYRGKQRGMAIFPLLVLALHCVLYAYLLWKGRTPERVRISLYMLGSAVLCGMMAGRKETEESKNEEIKGLAAAGLLFVVCILGFCKLPFGIYEEQRTVNEREDVIYSFMYAHSDSLCLMETSTSVYRTVSVFHKGAAVPQNVLLLGGWLYGSPLQLQKLQSFGYDSIRDIFAKGGVYYLCRENTGMAAEDFRSYLVYRFGEDSVQMERLENIGDFTIYQITGSSVSYSDDRENEE